MRNFVVGFTAAVVLVISFSQMSLCQNQAGRTLPAAIASCDHAKADRPVQSSVSRIQVLSALGIADDSKTITDSYEGQNSIVKRLKIRLVGLDDTAGGTGCILRNDWKNTMATLDSVN
jgi:hypothetical protein